MTRKKQDKALKKILDTARREGIGIRIHGVSNQYVVYVYDIKELESCLKEFGNKIVTSKLTQEEFVSFCMNGLSHFVESGKSEKETCQQALKKFKSRKEKKYVGVLEPWFETGTEGIIWSVQEDGKDGYDGLNVIKAGDHLTVYDEKGKTYFKGKIYPDHKAGWRRYPKNSKCGQPCALGCWVHWTQIGWEPDDWARLFMGRKGESPLRAELIQVR